MIHAGLEPALASFLAFSLGFAIPGDCGCYYRFKKLTFITLCHAAVQRMLYKFFHA
jgi:hypothetical protein